MAKDRSANIINWIAGIGAAYFIGSAIAGAIKRKRESTEGIGAVKSKRRIWSEIRDAQRAGVDLEDPTGYEGKESLLKRMAEGIVKPSNSTKPLEQRYFNQLRRAYKSIAGTELPYTESEVKNKYGDTILIYRDYHLDRLPIDAANFIMERAEDDLYGGNTERANYWMTIAAIAQNNLKFVWNDKGIHRGAGTLIFGHSAPEERKLRISYIATPEKGGVYPEKFAHQVWEEDVTGRSDTQSILDGILDAIRTCTSVGEARQMCIDEYLTAHQAQEVEYDNDPGEDLPF